MSPFRLCHLSGQLHKKQAVSLIFYLWPLSAVFLFFLTGNSARLFAEEPPPKKRKDTAQITFMSTNGNSKTTTLGASHFFAYSYMLVVSYPPNSV